MNDPAQRYAQAIDALNRGEWQLAQRLAAQVAPFANRHGGLHFVAGVAALQLQQMPLAIGHLQRAAAFSPERADYLAQYARALAMSHHYGESVQIADKALALPCSDPVAFDTLGVVYTQANLHRKAADAFRRAAELQPGHANYRFNLATSCVFFGDLDGAEREYEACLAADPEYWRAHMGLAHLRKQTAQSNHIDRLRSLLPRHAATDEAQLYLNLSLAKELEDIDEHANAFEHYRLGKAVHRAKIGSQAQRDADMFDALVEYFDGPVVDGSGCESTEPIFVMGMPRTGTTLVDRILSAHGEVYSAGELGDFGIMLQRMGGKPSPSLRSAIANLGPRFSAWAQLGKGYLDSTRPGTGHTPRFVDKLPHNFLYAGFIARALPNARLICLRRNPMDTCLSNFRQLFALESPNYDYSCDLLDTGRYYLQFDRLLKYWQRCMPGRILEVDYEQLVESQEATTRQLLAFCDLSWDETCLRFEDNEAPVSTASAVQVRSAMNRSSMQRWKRYEAQLGELRQLLEEGGVRID